MDKAKIAKKKEILKELKLLLNIAWGKCNKLIVDEGLHSSNEDHIYKLRQDIESCKNRLDFIKYPNN